MPRDVDPKQTRKALRIVRKLAAKGAAAETGDPETGEVKPGEGAVDYSQWETEFLTEVDQRLEKYGSAFADLNKGRKEDALSSLQTVKLKEIAALIPSLAVAPEGDVRIYFKDGRTQFEMRSAESRWTHRYVIMPVTL